MRFTLLKQLELQKYSKLTDLKIKKKVLLKFYFQENDYIGILIVD